MAIDETFPVDGKRTRGSLVNQPGREMYFPAFLNAHAHAENTVWFDEGCCDWRRRYTGLDSRLSIIFADLASLYTIVIPRFIPWLTKEHDIDISLAG